MTCKPGDLAIVRGVQSTPGLNGVIVEILAPVVHDEHFISTSGVVVRCDVEGMLVWRVAARGPLPWNTQTSLGLAFFDEMPMRDSRLIPISGVPVNDEVSEDLTREVTA